MARLTCLPALEEHAAALLPLARLWGSRRWSNSLLIQTTRMARLYLDEVTPRIIAQIRAAKIATGVKPATVNRFLAHPQKNALAKTVLRR